MKTIDTEYIHIESKTSPNFKIGDVIQHNKTKMIVTIKEIVMDVYLCDKGFIRFACQNEWNFKCKI